MHLGIGREVGMLSFIKFFQQSSQLSKRTSIRLWYTGLGEKVGPRLRELAPRIQREPGGGIHET